MAGVRHLPAAIDPLSFAVSGFLSFFLLPSEIIKKGPGVYFRITPSPCCGPGLWRPLSDLPRTVSAPCVLSPGLIFLLSPPYPHFIPGFPEFLSRIGFLFLFFVAYSGSPFSCGVYPYPGRFRVAGYSVVRSCSLSLSVLIICQVRINVNYKFGIF